MKTQIVSAGESLDTASKVLIMVHGRGGTASDILTLAPHLEIDGFALLAPQASQYTWYPYSFLAEPKKNEPSLSEALDALDETVKHAVSAGFKKKDIYFLGFSQGACLTLEYITRNATQWGGAVAFTGGLIGDRVYEENYKGDFGKTPVFIGTSDPDPHVPVDRVLSTTAILRKMNASVNEKIYPFMGHTISGEELRLANQWVFNRQGERDESLKV
ncbi:dienelactone hydrolase family protein [Terrimonas sp. NA20]|uniref:Dienelactone hydrolase family protein n=1 Tax=Terrimonas ginsenosidimutans TaxID=2908004 RepID=A0ABS9KYM0_9BACT|nr:dienelactone hydrolase family protein [Terrimonas ginsenosidimutans]MCG2617440.1 dienelactone hydrolase family protein [Terrimonas ginsenosidimutans]